MKTFITNDGESHDMDHAIGEFYKIFKAKVSKLLDDDASTEKKLFVEDLEWGEFCYEYKSELGIVDSKLGSENDQYLYCLMGVIKKIEDDDYFVMSKKKYMVQMFMNVDFASRKTQTQIRELIVSNIHLSSVDDFMGECMRIVKVKNSEGKKLMEEQGLGYKDEDKIELSEFQLYEDHSQITNGQLYNIGEWVTIYRGFNTQENESIRYSDNKDKADYYRQIEGGGFSFTTCKYIAFGFAVRFHIAMMDRVLKHDMRGADYKEFHKAITQARKYMSIIESDKTIQSDTEEDIKFKESDKILGRISVGRYVIHKDNIFGYNNYLNEREILCDSRDAKLIDYQFLSDNKGFSKDMDTIKDYEIRLMQKQHLETKKDLFINSIWKTFYKVSKEQEILFSKTKK